MGNPWFGAESRTQFPVSGFQPVMASPEGTRPSSGSHSNARAAERSLGAAQAKAGQNRAVTATPSRRRKHQAIDYFCRLALKYPQFAMKFFERGFP
jgi:hypothetical protein